MSARPANVAGLTATASRTTLPLPAVRSSSGPPSMGRRRSKDFDLPPRMQRKGEALYYVTNDVPRRWIPLGSDRARALRRYADLECESAPHTVETLLARFIADELDGLSAQTKKMYTAYARTLTAEFGTLSVTDVRSVMVANWQDRNRHRKGWTNGCLVVLRIAFRKAKRWGWCEQDLSIELFPMQPRRRYLENAEFVAIREKCPPWLQNAMDLSYLTSLRRSDVLALRWSAVTDVITVTQRKTGARQAFDIGPELVALLDRCKLGKIRGLFVIADDKGRAIKDGKLQRFFDAARTAAGVADCVFHDIRAKSATDAKKDGLNYQAMLGHTSQAMSDRYIRSKETVRAQSLRRKL